MAVQITLPILALTQGVPSLFGFHMFARVTFVNVAVYDERGEAIPIELGDWVFGRPELNWPSVLPALVCSELDDAHRVVVSDQERTVDHPC